MGGCGERYRKKRARCATKGEPMTQVPIWPERDRTTGRGSVDHLERYYTPAGGGAFLRALRDLDGLQVKANDTDSHSWAVQHGGATCCDLFRLHTKADRVVGNPPFSNAEAHVERCLQLADEVAFLMPLDRLETAGRLAFWQRHPPRRIWVLAERVWSGSRACAFYWWTKTHTHTQLDVISWKGSK